MLTNNKYANSWFKLNSMNIDCKMDRQTVLLQMIFYKFIKKFIGDHRIISIPFFDELDDIISSSDLMALFNKFHKYINCHGSQGKSAEIIVDVFGRVYEEIIPQQIRRKHGQFRTPESIAMLMTSWLLQNCKRNSSYRLLDAGSGAGVFLLHLYKIALKENINLTLEGIEINPLLVNALIGNFSLYRYTIPIVYLEDFLFMNFESKYDLVICNPPYTRHHSIPENVKNSLINRFKNLYGIEISRLSSMPVYLLLKTLEILKEGGHGIFIIPTEIFDSKYGYQVKKLLYKQVQIDALLRFSHNHDAFPDTDVTAIILLFTKKEPTSDHKVKLVLINSLYSSYQILDDIKKPVRGYFKYDWGVVRTIYQHNLNPDFKLLYIVSNDEDSNKLRSNNILYLKDLANIVRGIATGANKFFLLSDEDVEKFSLHRHVVRTIDKNRYIQDIWLSNEDWEKLRLSGKKVWLLYINSDAELDEQLEKYLNIGCSLGVPNRSLVRTRKKWYYMERRDIPPIIFTYLSRDNPRFILNDAKVRPLNTFLLIYPKSEIVDKGLVEVLWAILNSSVIVRNLKNIGRSYGANTTKVEPRELDKLPVINPLALPKKMVQKIKEIVAIFKKTRNKEQFINSIDSVVKEYLSNLGFSELPLNLSRQLALSEYERYVSKTTNKED